MNRIASILWRLVPSALLLDALPAISDIDTSLLFFVEIAVAGVIGLLWLPPSARRPDPEPGQRRGLPRNANGG